MKFTKEDIELIEKLIEIKNRGYYCDGKQLTEVYNRVLEKNVNVTNCGSCMRQRIGELEEALNRFRNVSSLHSNPLGVSKRLSETKKEEEVTPDKVEENKALREENMKEKMAKVRAAKKNK